MTLEELRRRRSEIMHLARACGAREVRVFGSVARGTAGADSDVDLAVAFRAGTSLLDHGRLLMDLQDLLGCRVDVVNARAAPPRLRRRIEAEAVPL